MQLHRSLWVLGLVGCGAKPVEPSRTAVIPSTVPASTQPVPASPATSPPTTRRDDFHETLHGVDIVDPYRWLEADDSVETRAWVAAQDNYAHHLVDGLPAREPARARLGELAKHDGQGAPLELAGRYFIAEHRANDDLWTMHVRDGLDGKDEVLLDPMPLSADHTTDVSVEDFAANGSRIVYSIRRGGGDESELRVRDVKTKRDLTEEYPRALYRGVATVPDGSAFYYALQDREKGTHIRYHVVGKPIASDTDVFGDGYAATDWVGAGVSENGRHLIYSVQHGWQTGEFFVQSPRLPPRA